MNRTITSTRGLIAWFLALLFLSTTVLSGLFLLRILTNGRGLDLEVLLSLVSLGITLPLFFGLTILTYTVEVTDQSISTRSLFTSRKVLGEEVSEIRVLPLYGYFPFFGYLFTITYGKRSSVLVPAAIYGNRHILTKAVLETIWRGNPRTRMWGSLYLTYGSPPYGIFERK